MAHEPLPLLNGRALEEALDRLARGHVCGECAHFKHEDIDGLGWCPLMQLTTSCNIRACMLFSQAPEGSAPAPGAEP